MDYEEIRVLKSDIMASMHCALPGMVVSFDAGTQTAVIQPAVKQKHEGREIALPLLQDVPVFMPVSFTVNPGDACLVIFADCDIDRWFETGGSEVPGSSRMHSLPDGFAFVGFRARRNNG